MAPPAPSQAAQRSATFLEALDQAGYALDRADEDEEASWIGIGTFNQAKLEAYHGVCYLQLGRPGDAVPALTRALDTLDPALKKHRCTALADLASGLIQLREVEEGCQRASQSLTLAPELRHGVSIDRIRKLERQLPPSQRSPAVRRLREQLPAVGDGVALSRSVMPGGMTGGMTRAASLDRS
jgi:tetratricopeptide (TPR) repeat protein